MRKYYEEIQEIDSVIIEDPRPEHLKDLFDLLNKKDSLENYFFDNVSDIKWFNFLKENGYFLPEKAPRPIQDEKDSNIHIRQWNVLPYLERISQQLDKPENEIYINELLEIITNVTKYHQENNKALDNYVTWSYFVKILLNLPNDKIPEQTIELIRVWLDSEFDTLITGSDIAMKLLPKFLDSDDQTDLSKAEKLVDIVTDIKWKKMNQTKFEFLRREYEAKTVIDTYWLAEAFKTNAEKVGKKCGTDIIYILADKLKEILREDSRPWNDLKIDNNHYRVAVKQMAEEEFNVTVYKIDENDLGDGEETDIVKNLDVKLSELYSFELPAVSDANEFVEKIKSEFSDKTDLKNITAELDDKLLDIFRGLSVDYSYIWYKSLFNKPSLNDAEQTLTKILRDILLAKAATDEKATAEVLKALISKKYQYPLFRRFFLFIVGSRWASYNNLFWKVLENGLGADFFEEPYYKAELYILLQKNVKNFAKDKKAIIEKFIVKGPSRFPPDENDDYEADWKQEWYSALKKDPDFKKLYNEKKKIMGTDASPNFMASSRASAGSGASPLTKSKILSRSNTDLAGYLIDLEEKRLFEGEPAEDIAEYLRAAVKENPGKFIENLGPFISVGYLYVYQIIAGAKEAWQENQVIDWGKLLEFVNSYIDREAFWNNEFNIKGDHLWKADHRWVTGAIGELIQGGVKNDARAFDATHFHITKEVLLLILEKQKTKDESEINDYVFHALNTSTGKVITALIYLTLRGARLKSKEVPEKEIRWPANIKTKYDELLERHVIESFTLLGQYLPNFYYLDKQWVKKKIGNISEENDTELWEAFMSGYLFGGKVYDELYELMRMHYEAALGYQFKEKETSNRLVQHIAVGYLRDRKSLEDKEILISTLLNNWHSDQINDLIGFFWTQRNYVEGAEEPVDFAKQVSEKVIEFWRWLYENKYGNNSVSLTEEDKIILSNLATLTIFLPQINNENVAWIKLSARYVNKAYKVPFLLEYLDNLKDKGDKKEISKYLSEIIMEMLAEFIPGYSSFEKDHVRSIVEFIYQTGMKNKADAICNRYGELEQYFLRDIYEKYNKNDG